MAVAKVKDIEEQAILEQDILRQANNMACLAFLDDALSEGEISPERRETHISHVFLTRERAYKLKKPVKLEFLDFSTVARREAACRREIVVNRAFAPEIYLGLRPILATRGGAMRLGPLLSDPDAPLPQAAGAEPETLIDWVVEMRRFDAGGEFDRLADERALTPGMMRALADKVSASHRAAPKLPEDRRGPGPAETIAQILAALAATPVAPAASHWAERAGLEASRIAPRLAARRRHGFPRRLHGDLHLGNICLLDGAPTPFDAIEFDDAIATIDPLYDVAFTAMDLLWRGEPRLAQVFLSRYLAATRDYGGLAAWPLFLSMRAAVRAMTAMLAGDERRALRKLRFAESLLAPPPAPRLVVIAGLSGTGKSTLARALAPSLGPFGGAVSISTDETRKRLYGKAPEEALGPEGYGPESSLRVYRRLGVDARRALTSGASAVLDGVFSHRRERDEARRMAESVGACFQGLWLEASKGERLSRVDRRSAAAQRDPSDADRAVAAAQSADFDPSEACWARLDADDDPSELLSLAQRRLGLSEI